MLSAAVWYRGRALPLAWALWPANTPLCGPGFWQRVADLLDLVATLLPVGVPVTWLADRAFGTPAFTDLVVAHGWHYVVRVQGQTHYRDGMGREQEVRTLVARRTDRCKRRGWVFKKADWRTASVIAYWGRRHDKPLCLVSDLPPQWRLIGLYRRRYPIEGTFRDYKSYGWQWEQGQVTDLQHLERLLVGMALATWLALMVGTQVAAELLARPPSGRRHTRPWAGKYSLFHLGLQRLQQWLSGRLPRQVAWRLSDWEAPTWQAQICAHHAQAFIFAQHPHG
jgi:Transposase DDE domain